jgi:hypothetical protein
MLERLAGWRRSWREFQNLAGQVRAETGRPVSSQFREWLGLRQAIGMSPREYFLYELYRQDRPAEEKLQYLTRALQTKFLTPLLPQAYYALLDDKFIFKQYYTSLGLPTPRIFGIYHPFHGRAADGSPLRKLSELRTLLEGLSGAGVVVKHAMSGSGRSVQVFEEVAGGRDCSLTRVDGERYSFDRFASMLTPSTPHDHPGYLLEERVAQHPFLERYNPKTLNTTRVVTLVANDGKVHVVGATLKIGLDASGVESLIEDHLGAAIDLETGRLGPATRRLGLRFAREPRHPLNEQPIEGEVLPEWPRIRELAVSATIAARRIRTIGWDIGLSSSGPVLIEGNQAWGEEILQIPLARGIWTPTFRALIDAPPSL